MQLKTVSSFGLAFLLVLGVVGVASAQEVAGTQGIAIRVEKPAANTWAKIGDKIVIRILTYDGRLDDGFLVTVRDTAVTDVATGGVSEDIYYTADVQAIGPGVNVPDNEDDERDILGDADEPVYVRQGLGSRIDTFTVTFTVVATANIETQQTNAVKVVVNPDAADNAPINNLMSDKKITPATAGFGATIVGDGVKFGIDANRPVQTNVFTSIVLDTDGLDVDIVGTPGADSTDVTKVNLAVGDEIVLNLGLYPPAILGVGAVRIDIGIVEVDSGFTTAPIKFTLGGDKLYETSAKVSGVLSEGDFADNQNVKIEAVIVDRAGNLGAATANSEEALPISALSGDVVNDDLFNDPWEITADGTSPKITIVYPHPDSVDENRITAAIAQDIQDSYGFEVGNSPPDVNPLSIELSEEVDSILVTHGDSTVRFGRRLTDDENETITPNQDNSRTENDFPPTGVDSSALLLLDIGYEAAGGTSGDLKVTVWDLLGNKSELGKPGIVHDGVKPTISNLFPTALAAPKNADNDDVATVNLTTKNPTFQYDEDLDSIAVRYRGEGGARSIMTAGWSRGNVDLEKPGQLVTYAINDTTFQERQRYELEVLAIDPSGNASVAKSGVLTFTKGFGNPDADMFKIVADPEEKQVAGVDISLDLSVIDTTLTLIEGDPDNPVRAVTYHTLSAVAVIVSGDQADALDGVSFSGTGVSPAPAFALPAPLAGQGMVAKAAILDGDGWHAGQRTVKVKSSKPLTGATVMAAEGALDPATATWVLRISGQAAKTLTVEVAEFAEFAVTAREGEISGGNVAGAFTVNVVPTDEFGNASMKIENTVFSETDDVDDVYESIAVTFASSNAAVSGALRSADGDQP